MSTTLLTLINRRVKAELPGKHTYSAESFGIDEQALRERMRSYTGYYDVRLEVV
jgi:hypothetical protein